MEEYRELDGERVLGLAQFSAHDKSSRVEIDLRLTRAVIVFHVDDGKVARLVVYLDRDRALAELGIEE